MSSSIYLINPAGNVPGYYGVEFLEKLGLPPAVLIADLATTTVAAMIPDDFDISICEEALSPADLDTDADFIAITGKSTQVARMIELGREYRSRGKVVVMGGPFVSLSRDSLRPYADVLVFGEMEEIADVVFNDLRNGTHKAEYQGTKPDITTSPIPRWDLYQNASAMRGCVQTSRGCPFECEFCDVIQYVGRKQRHKSNSQVLAELDVLYRHGYRSAFLADDNFTVYRKRTRSLLTALHDWNLQQQSGHMRFSTQVSIDIAKDTDILEQCADAGVNEVFIGIETPNEASLKETHKNQNMNIDLQQQVGRFLEQGISVTAGMIVGFDADGPDIFEQQRDFAMASAIPLFTLGALMAPISTPLYDRMKEENRLIPESETGASMHPWISNIIPARMTSDELRAGMKWLINQIYHPRNFGQRLLKMIQDLQFRPSAAYYYSTGNSHRMATMAVTAMRAMMKLSRMGSDEAAMMKQTMQAVEKKPESRTHVMTAIFQYLQTRHLCEDSGIWDPSQADQPKPRLEKFGKAA